MGKALFRNVQTGLLRAHNAGLASAQGEGAVEAELAINRGIVAVIKGDKSAQEAMNDIVSESGQAVLDGYITAVKSQAKEAALSQAYKLCAKSSSKLARSMAKNNVPGKVIDLVNVVGTTLERYAKGEITTRECLIELGDNSLNMVASGYAMAVGQALVPIPYVGAVLGACVGSIVASGFSQSLLSELKRDELAHRERLRLTAEAERVRDEARAFRKELEQYMLAYLQDYQDCFDEAISTITVSLRNGDADGAIAGANAITRKLGGEVQYNNMEEFDAWFADDSVASV